MMIGVPAQAAEDSYTTPGSKVRTHDMRSQVMQRLEQTLLAYPTKRHSIPELSAKVGVSARTLGTYCQELLGMSPSKYLRTRRMTLAWLTLLSADAEATTVTEVATDHDFWELGRFAVEYRKMFGEAPSVTLRRAPTSAAFAARDWSR
jgi:AraC-like DNA-binding protein